MQALDLAAHLVAQLGIEIGQRFVEQEQARIAHDGAADGDALALAAGELARQALQQAGDAQHLGGLAHPCLDLGLRRLARAQAEGDVLEHVHVRVERVVLEHHGDVAIARAHMVHHAPADLDGAFLGFLQPGDGAQQGALAAARRPDQHGELAGRHFQVDAAHGRDMAVALVQAGDLQIGHDSASRLSGVCMPQPFTAPSEMPRTR